MAVTSVKEIQDGRDGSQNIEGVCTYTRTFRVITNDAYDEAEQILGDTRLPAVGSVYPYNSAAYLESRDISQEGQTKRFWIVTCKYTTKRTTPDGQGTKSEDPYFDPIEISWTAKKIQIPFTEDADGWPVVNSAGEPFQVPPERIRVMPCAVVKRNWRNVSFDLFNLVDTINNADVTLDGLTFTAKRLLLDDVSVSGWRTRNNIWYREVTLNILVDEAGESRQHKLQVGDFGMNCLQTWWDSDGNPVDDGYLVPCINKRTGNPVNSPVPLIFGVQKDVGPGTHPEWLYFQPHTAADWTPLRLV